MTASQRRPHLIPLKDAAAYTFATERHMRTLVATRKVTYYKIAGRILFDVADLDRLVDAARVEGTLR